MSVSSREEGPGRGRTLPSLKPDFDMSILDGTSSGTVIAAPSSAIAVGGRFVEELRGRGSKGEDSLARLLAVPIDASVELSSNFKPSPVDLQTSDDSSSPPLSLLTDKLSVPLTPDHRLAGESQGS